MKYLILGNGYIGKYLAKTLPNATMCTTKVYNIEQLRDILKNQYPSYTLINCAGKTGRPNIDWCEENKETTFVSNVWVPTLIAEVCKELGRYWVHIGSGCVYSGYDKEWTEEDIPNFIRSYYSKTKIWSQNILSDYVEVCILRIRMPIDEDLQERCYISKLIKYSGEDKSLFNAQNSMTILSDMVSAIRFLTERGMTGTVNVVNKGSINAEETMELYKKYVEKVQYTIEDITEVSKRLKAGRTNCILSTKKLEDLGFKMPELKEGIQRILEKYNKLDKGK